MAKTTKKRGPVMPVRGDLEMHISVERIVRVSEGANVLDVLKRLGITTEGHVVLLDGKRVTTETVLKSTCAVRIGRHLGET